jgi:Methyltransferase domain
MIEALKRRARKAGLADRIDARSASPSSMELSDLDAAIDFVFAFAVVHEMPSAATIFLGAARAMKPGAELLLAEPAGHLGKDEFEEEMAAARAHGLSVIDSPPLKGCITALLRKP